MLPEGGGVVFFSLVHYAQKEIENKKWKNIWGQTRRCMDCVLGQRNIYLKKWRSCSFRAWFLIVSMQF